MELIHTVESSAIMSFGEILLVGALTAIGFSVFNLFFGE